MLDFSLAFRSPNKIVSKLIASVSLYLHQGLQVYDKVVKKRMLKHSLNRHVKNRFMTVKVLQKRESQDTLSQTFQYSKTRNIFHYHRLIPWTNLLDQVIWISSLNKPSLWHCSLSSFLDKPSIKDSTVAGWGDSARYILPSLEKKKLFIITALSR